MNVSMCSYENGFKEARVLKICLKNVLRVFRECIY